MIDRGGECEPVLTQVLAARSALGQLGLHVIGYSMKRCLSSGEDISREALLDQSLEVFVRYRRLAVPVVSEAARAPRTGPDMAAGLEGFCRELEAIESALVSGGSCEQLVTDIGRATGTLNEVALGVLGHAMSACLVPEGSDREETIDEAMRVFLKYSACLR